MDRTNLSSPVPLFDIRWYNRPAIKEGSFLLTVDRMILSLSLIIGSYLLGSVSSSYLVGRWLGRKDLRNYGSGSLGGSMVYEHVGRLAVVPVVLFDIGKAALPAWLAIRLGLGTAVAALAGMAAVVGHDWPIFLRFYGGRGMGSFAGLLLVLFPWGLVWLTAIMSVGWRLGDSGPLFLFSVITMPLVSRHLGGSEVVTPVCAAMLLVTLLKRLEANRRPLPPAGSERSQVILLRLLFDRDTLSHERWLRQGPNHPTP
jgi:acyl phosphate:glycerol-3-phosphate acyltransferase